MRNEILAIGACLADFGEVVDGEEEEDEYEEGREATEEREEEKEEEEEEHTGLNSTEPGPTRVRSPSAHQFVSPRGDGVPLPRILRKQRWVMKAEGGAWDRRTREWFEGLPGKPLHKLERGPRLSARDAARRIDQWLRAIEFEHPRKLWGPITLVSDNPSFDIGLVDMLLSKHTERMPLRYDTHGTFRRTEDCSSVTNGLPRTFQWQVRTTVANVMGRQPSHLPDDDALRQMLTLFFASLAREETESRILQAPNVHTGHGCLCASVYQQPSLPSSWTTNETPVHGFRTADGRLYVVREQ